jgi:hypothetical protein
MYHHSDSFLSNIQAAEYLVSSTMCNCRHCKVTIFVSHEYLVSSTKVHLQTLQSDNLHFTSTLSVQQRCICKHCKVTISNPILVYKGALQTLQSNKFQSNSGIMNRMSRSKTGWVSGWGSRSKRVCHIIYLLSIPKLHLVKLLSV